MLQQEDIKKVDSVLDDTAGQRGVLIAVLQRWLPSRAAYHGLPFLLAAAFVLIAALPHNAPGAAVAPRRPQRRTTNVSTSTRPSPTTRISIVWRPAFAACQR